MATKSTTKSPKHSTSGSAKTVTILHLYPKELNIYGDRGNIITLTKRLEWRGYRVRLLQAGVGDNINIEAADLIFGGGGQDRGQLAVGRDLQRHAAPLRRAAADGVPMLTICGTYQLFGRGFRTLEGEEIPGIGLFGAETVGSDHRMIGNAIINTPFGRLVGFENHSGRTLLDANQQALGAVVQGYGNDGTSGMEGAMVNNAYGTYLHGPILPKNPVFADLLIRSVLTRKFGTSELQVLNDNLEQLTARDAAHRPQ
jgi:CobQ-like glutamine amidotransferase family enzyme